MKKSIVVSIIESKLFPKDIGCHSIFSVREQNTGHRLCDRLEFHFLELGKVDPRKPLEEICAEFIQRLFPGKKEKDYKDLKPSYVIFICMKDPFEMGEAIYQFQMIDKNLQLQLNDETYTIILAIDCPKGKIPKELETFFAYVEREEVDENVDFVKRIHEKVEEVNRDTEVTEIMTIEEEMNIRWHYGYDEGEAAGLKKGRSEGEAIGLEKGVVQEKREIAKNLKVLGVGTAKIIKATGLSAEEVEEL